MEITDVLDAAGNGFSIGSVALVWLALFGALSVVLQFRIWMSWQWTRKVVIGWSVLVVLHFWFSALSMRSLGSAALKMVKEVRSLWWKVMLSKLEYDNCMKISADASLMKMIPPGFLVTCTPFIVETPRCYGDRFSEYV